MTALYTFTQSGLPEPPQVENLNLIRGDAYDDVANPKLSWRFPNGVVNQQEQAAAVLCIRRQGDVDLSEDAEFLLIDNDSFGDVISFQLTSSDTNSLFIDGRSSIFNYDVQADIGFADDWQTLVRGTLTVTLAETRR